MNPTHTRFPRRFWILLGFIASFNFACCKCPSPQAAGRPEAPSLEERMKNPVKVDVGSAPTRGPSGAPITIVEFSDFQCPFCKRAVSTLEQLMKEYDGKIRWAFRHHPLPFHSMALSAAKASLAANEQGKFWEMHDRLMENQANLSDETIRKIAKEIGLNMNKFEKAWNSDRFKPQIEEDIRFAEANGATGTPTFYINGVIVKGAQPIDSFRAVIDVLLKRK